MVSDTWPERRNHPPSRGGNPRTGALDEAEGNPRDGRKTASETVLRLDLLEKSPFRSQRRMPHPSGPQIAPGAVTSSPTCRSHPTWHRKVGAASRLATRTRCNSIHCWMPLTGRNVELDVEGGRMESQDEVPTEQRAAMANEGEGSQGVADAGKVGLSIV